MNVWAPVAASGSPRRTVVVVVTGKWFQSEYNTDFDGADLAAAGDFIVAVPNHRVGVFGFLNAGVGGAVGNAAVEDLLLALSWLQKNAWKFHGDPEDLVALGLGSGAFLLSVILMSPEFNVFRRAFFQGPYPTSPIPLNTPAHGQVYVAEMARSLGCPEGDILSQVKCLRSASENEIMKSTINVTAELPFVPGSFYGVALTQLHKRAALGEVTLMLGSDVYDARAMFQRVVPVGDLYRNGFSEVDVFAYFLRAMRGVAVDKAPIRLMTRGLSDVGSLPELEDYIVNLWTVCFPRIIADEAAAKNGTVYRYIVTKRSPYRIRDVFDIEMVAGFLKNALCILLVAAFLLGLVFVLVLHSTGVLSLRAPAAQATTGDDANATMAVGLFAFADAPHTPNAPMGDMGELAIELGF
ncbi:carboxylesterase 5A-like [Haemaphysalis longicornis]